MWSGGRFVLGLGSQVGPTLEARYGVVADHPARRMEDYVAAVRACFAAFRDGFGKHQGEFYKIRRPGFQPGGEPAVTAPPIYVAAVNPRMARSAGECSDGLAAHPFTTASYIAEVLRPALADGARRADREVPPILLQRVVAPDRDTAARQMVAYTVPAYRRVLDHAGQGEVADRVMAAGREGRRAEAAALIADSYLDLLGVVLESELEAGIARWAPLADRLALSVPWFGMTDHEQLAAAGRLVGGLERLR
jgi:alkanesulfonate monooxygenase SsuD/methylene tetrahydromethanopterin reductase-like flavin-dependent oxidoreductase (luciferase family)